MKNKKFNIERILIHPDSFDSDIARKFISIYKNSTIEITNNVQHFKSISKTKKGRSIFLSPFKGNFLKPCPCTPVYLGCDYYVMNVIANCTLECTYCILQAYLDNPLIWVYTNTDKLFEELNTFLSANSSEFYRIGTGELSDSLIFDNITGYSSDLIRFFSHKQNAVLELKTKTTNIFHLLNIAHNGKTVMAWSLNPTKMARSEELRSDSPSERIKAAEICYKHGYLLAFHFDPIIHYPGWEREYELLIDELFSSIPPHAIAWISLGSLRFMPALKDVAISNYPGSKIFFDEFIRGMDGKLRYFIDLRLMLYSHVVAAIKKHSTDIPLYFCMESEEVWERILGWVPNSESQLRHYLTRRFIK